MIRLISVSFLATAFMAALLAAGDDPAPPKNGKDAKDPDVKKDDAPKDPKKGDEKKDQDPKKKAEPATDDEEPLSPEKIKEIIARLNKNLEDSETRLDKKDPGPETRKIQDQIIKDLDDLMKQQNNNNNQGGGGGGGGASSKGGGSSKGGSDPKGGGGNSKGGGANSKGSNDPKTAKGGGDPKGKKDGKEGDNGNKKKNDQAKGGGKDDKDKGKDGNNQNAKGGGKDGGAGKGGKDKDQKRDNTIADLNRDPWGDLPATKRLEMDVYSKERFLPRYEELLRQYYRTISEQGRLKGGN